MRGGLLRPMLYAWLAVEVVSTAVKSLEDERLDELMELLNRSPRTQWLARRVWELKKRKHRAKRLWAAFVERQRKKRKQRRRRYA